MSENKKRKYYTSTVAPTEALTEAPTVTLTVTPTVTPTERHFLNFEQIKIIVVLDDETLAESKHLFVRINAKNSKPVYVSLSIFEDSVAQYIKQTSIPTLGSNPMFLSLDLKYVSRISLVLFLRMITSRDIKISEENFQHLPRIYEEIAIIDKNSPKLALIE